MRTAHLTSRNREFTVGSLPVTVSWLDARRLTMEQEGSMRHMLHRLSGSAICVARLDVENQNAPYFLPNRLSQE